MRQQDQTVRVEPRVLERVHALDDFLLLEVDHGHRPVAHARKVQQSVLHEGIALVGRDPDVVRALGDRDRFDQLRLLQAAAHIEDVQVSGLRGRDIETVRLAVEIDLQGHAARDGREVECLRRIKILPLRVPSEDPERAAIHVGDISGRRIGAGREQELDRRIARGRSLA